MIRALIILFQSAALSVGMLAARSSRPGPGQDATAVEVQSLLDRGLYDRAEALSRTRVAILSSAQGVDSPEVADASDLLVQSLLLNGKGGAIGTRSLAEHSLRRRESHLGAAHPDLVPSLLNLGDVLVEVPDYRRAIAALQRAVALRRRTADSRTVDFARTLDHLGAALIAAGRYDDALRALERSLQSKEAVPDITYADLARTLEAIGLALQRQGDYVRAGVAVRRAMTLREEAAADHPAYVETLNLLGLQFWFEGKLPEARDTAAGAVALAERTLRPDHPAIARALRYLAGAYLDLGDLARARSLLERALAIAEANVGPTHHEVGACLHDLGGPNRMLGNYPSARALFERSLRIFEATCGRWHDHVATAVHNLALVDASLGDYGRARREQARAAAIWQQKFGPDHPFVAVALTELATAHREQGAPGEALPLLERALAIRERRLGPSHRDVALTLSDLGATLMQLGRAERAQFFAARALRIWEGLGIPDAPDLATVLTLYAELQANRGDAADARQYYERALAIREQVFGRSHPTFADSEAGLARALANLGDHRSAFYKAADAETTGRNHLRLMVRHLPERQALHYAASRPRGLDLALSLVGAVPDAPAIAMGALIRGRALVLDEMAARRSASRSETGDARRLRAALGSAQQRLANLAVRGPGDLPPARYAALLDEARGDSERAERSLAEISADFRAEQAQTQVGLDDVSASLPAQSVLVSFVRYERTQLEPPDRATPTAVRRRPGLRTVASYLAFVLRPGEPPVPVALGAANAIDPLVHRWRHEIVAEAQSEAGASAAGALTSRTSGAELRRRVWDPVTQQLKGARRIFIVPDGALSLVPFVALPVERARYLLEQAAPIHHLSAERDLVTAPPERTRYGLGLLAIGGPAFDAPVATGAPGKPAPAVPAVAGPSVSTRGTQESCGNLQSIRFPPLTGTLREVREIAQLWRSPSPGADVETARVLVGRHATERAFKDEAPRHRVLHLATHGFFLGDRCVTPPGATRGVGGLATLSGRRPNAKPPENPLLLSGLALAGANRRAAARADEDDGVLTAEEVASLNLGSVELAVLSACDTGVGEVKAGEGVFGLRRAFQIAGARTVVMSLWSVDDQATRAWMRALYDGRFQQGLPTADAVHAASLAMLRQRRAKTVSTHPFYWAAFVAVGDWR